MRFHNGQLLHSASDLNAFLGCRHAITLNLQKRRDPPSLPERAVDDESTILVQDAGHAHEGDYLEDLKRQLRVVEVDDSVALELQAEATLAAMRDGADIIYQATFLDQPWHGFADFLRRVDVPSHLGNHSYEVIDTKLARTPSPKHVLQLALYSDMIAKVQGVAPHEMHLVLGDKSEVSFRRIEFEHTLASAKARYLDFVDAEITETRPEPCSACTYCGWRDLCAERWREEDHLSLVAGIQAPQITKLKAAGIQTVAQLAGLEPGTSVSKLAPKAFERLRAQAALQLARRGGEPTTELLPIEPGRGFARMPAPNPHDLFFDLEGDPLYPDGLEYLWGVHLRDAQGDPVFRFEWGHDRAAEQLAFEAMVDFFSDHIAEHPEAHIYHYAPYEVTVLRRLSTRFASREHAVDELLRAEKFVDLYGIVRGAIRTSEPDLSLKTLETFFAESRGEDVTKADQSIVHYHRWRESGEQALLDGILAYNKVDCENTEGLRDWLLSLRPEIPFWQRGADAPSEEKTEEARQAEVAREALRTKVRQDALCLSKRGRELASHLLDFHYRARKPELWAIFDRCEREEDELVDDGECIGGIEPDGDDWQRPEKQSIVARYRFAQQDTKLRVGSTVLHAPSLERFGTVFDLDLESGVVELKRGKKSGTDWPEKGSVIPSWPIGTELLEAAVERVVRSWADASEAEDIPYHALVDVIERAKPRFTDGFSGDLVETGQSLIEAATERALALDHSSLFIQGPPGTGKTYTSAHMILALLKAGKRVGVSSNSHKAINNLLAKVEDVAIEDGYHIRGAKKVSASDKTSYLRGSMLEDVANAKDMEDGYYELVGGTAWLFARGDLDQHFDYLVGPSSSYGRGC
jgi:predicted RecB family nuclease